MRCNGLIRAMVVLLAGLCQCACAGGVLPGQMHDQLVGRWQIDMKATEPLLDAYLRQAQLQAPGASLAGERDRMTALLQNQELQFTMDALKQSDGIGAGIKRYTVTKEGENFVVIREYLTADHPLAQGERGQELLLWNDMSVESIVHLINQLDGNAPLLTGFEFIDSDTFRIFHLKVNNQQITDQREYGIEVFKRVKAGALPAKH